MGKGGRVAPRNRAGHAPTSGGGKGKPDSSHGRPSHNLRGRSTVPTRLPKSQKGKK